MTVALKILQNDYDYFELSMIGGTFEYIRVTNKMPLCADVDAGASVVQNTCGKMNKN